MKKIFLVESEDWDYDQYDSGVVIANDMEEALKIGKTLFEANQGDVTATEINLNTEESRLLLSSFNAG